MPALSHVVLPGSRREQAHGATALHPSEPEAEMDVTVKLRRKAPLPAIDPKNPQVLSREDLEDQYGASPDDLKEASETFEKYGLKIVRADAETRSLYMTGTVSDVEKTFAAKLFQFQKDGETFRGRTGDLSVPAELDGIVTGVFGLDERRVVRKRRRGFAPDAHATQRRQGLFGSELAALYNFPPGDGAGQTIAILEFGGGFFADDLAKFSQLAGIDNPHVQAVSVDNAPTDQKDGQEGEVMLDAEVIVSACPKAAINVYFCSFDEQGWVDILDQVLKDAPAVVSCSWGSAEDDPNTWTQGAVTTIDDTLQQLALAGITVCVASGDDGSYDQVDDGLAHVDFPSVSSVLAVGGTSFSVVNNQISDEVVWKEGDGRRNDGGASTGGGVSVIFKRPSWQTVSVPSVNPNPIDGRVVPDVSALAGVPAYAIVVDGKIGAEEGTSAAAPLWASLLCRIIAAAKQAGKAAPVPFLTPLLYQVAQSAPTAFNDITVGDNDSAQIGGYSAGPGFDACTGWGTPNGVNLLNGLLPLLPVAAPPAPAVPPAQPAP